MQSHQVFSSPQYSNIGSANLGEPTELLVHWKFDELTGRTAGDASKRANNGSLKGGLNFTSSSVPGMDGKALKLDGSNDYISGTDNGRYLPAEDYPFTLSAWVKTTHDGVLLHFGDKDLGRNLSSYFGRDPEISDQVILSYHRKDLTVLAGQTCSLPDNLLSTCQLAIGDDQLCSSEYAKIMLTNMGDPVSSYAMGRWYAYELRGKTYRCRVLPASLEPR
ncbi:MAG TPA: hypothetical protein VE954_35340 [Oligoflexus sp.]|uniref:hypothetical protein n=1 Tax=Oligoflexus sp. TaxID=1971216 RepID=UPI002D6AAFDF|nr:hypothetical protein [Oligoflexus sp.]HYX38407.1 hypothetical protein [Oligoflexus sp.]